MTRCGFGERGLVGPNERAETQRVARKGPSQKGFAGKAASRALRPSAVATATVTRVAPHDLRLFRLKRAPRRVVQRFPAMATQYMAAVPEAELRSRVGSLAEKQDEISAALDMLFLGF